MQISYREFGETHTKKRGLGETRGFFTPRKGDVFKYQVMFTQELIFTGYMSGGKYFGLQ